MSNNDNNLSRRLARLAAVQALYRGSFGQETVGEILNDEIIPEMLVDEAAIPAVAQPDAELCNRIVLGVTENMESIDAMLKGALSDKLSPNRMEILLRTILRAGIYELHHCPSTPTGVIINDYVDVAHAFFDDREPGLVNGVLDKLGQVLRETKSADGV